MNQFLFQLRQMQRKMWFLPAAFSMAAVISVTLAYYVARFAPDTLPFTMPSQGVMSVLTILASSLLTVAVFALSSMMAAVSAASQATTPRAVPLILGDRQAQTSISVFIGAFLFSIVGIIGLSAGVYSEAGRLILFGVTLAIVIMVVMALIRWIGQISAIGRVAETIDRAETAARGAFKSADSPANFGCLKGEKNFGETAVHADSIGYVQHFDISALQTIAEDLGLIVHVNARPGAYVDADRPLALVTGTIEEDKLDGLRRAFVIGDSRTFDSDPRFGLVVLGEIAGKALSPGINDPGTAIDVIGTGVRVLSGWTELEPGEVKYDRVSVPPLVADDMLEDIFRPIARDGAATIEVVLRLLAALKTISHLDANLYEPARRMAEDVRSRALKAMTSESDKATVERAMRDRFNA